MITPNVTIFLVPVAAYDAHFDFIVNETGK